MSRAAPSSISELATSLDSTLDMLEAALAKLQGPVPVHQPGSSSSSPQRTVPEFSEAPSRVLEFSSMAADFQPPDPTLIDTPTIHEHLRRLYVYFCSSPAASETQNRDVGSRAPMLSTYGFTKLARAAQLIGERCTPVDVDLIFCKVVKTRASRMGLADMLRGLAILALRLYPEHATQAEAFHRLLSDHLLPWMLQLEAALVECQLGAAPLGLLFERHSPFTQLVFDTYLNAPVQPISPAVAALPIVLLQWPQLVAFAQDFELCPTLIAWPQLMRQFCFVGTCAVAQQWQRPEAHGLTAAQFAALLGWCALEVPIPPPLRAPEAALSREASPHAAASLKLKALFAHLQLSRGAQQLRSREAASGLGTPIAT